MELDSEPRPKMKGKLKIGNKDSCLSVNKMQCKYGLKAHCYYQWPDITHTKSFLGMYRSYLDSQSFFEDAKMTNFEETLN